MITMLPFQLPTGSYVQAIEVKLPKTTLLMFSTEYGYIMCGAHDIFQHNNVLDIIYDWFYRLHSVILNNSF